MPDYKVLKCLDINLVPIRYHFNSQTSCHHKHHFKKPKHYKVVGLVQQLGDGISLITKGCLVTCIPCTVIVLACIFLMYRKSG